MHALIKVIMGCSFQLGPNHAEDMLHGVPNPLLRPSEFKKHMSLQIRDFIRQHWLSGINDGQENESSYRAFIFSDVAEDDSSSVCRIKVCLQAGFLDPPIRDEETLFRSIFGRESGMVAEKLGDANMYEIISN